MSHYSGAPRRNFVMVHHTGVANSHLDDSTNYCSAGYDFHIRRLGYIVVCSRWANGTGAHANGCNCTTIGIMLNGCFGGCTSGNVLQPTGAQECSLAYLIAHLRTPDLVDRLRPHRTASTGTQCSGSPGGTVCCGSNLTAATADHHSWNAAGRDFRERVRAKRRSIDAVGQC